MSVHTDSDGQLVITVGPGVEMSSYSSLRPKEIGFVASDALAVAAAFASFRNTALTQFATTRRVRVWSLLEEISHETCVVGRGPNGDMTNDLQNLAELTRWVINEVREFQENE
jgi:hypothetical protein